MSGRLLRFQLRRERVLLPVWVIAIAGLFAGSGAAVAREFGDEQQRAALMAVATGNPAFLFLRGLPDGTSEAAVTFFQTFAFLGVLTALMNVFLVTRHTRAEEDTGRGELLQATPIGRTSTLASTLVLALLADVAVGLLVAGGAAGLGFDPGGAVVLGLALASVGIAFAGVTAFVAQFMPTSRSTNGLAAALVGVAYLTRGLGDALGTATDAAHVTPAWISFLSPLGWAQHTRPFSEADPLPALGGVLLGLVTATLALAIRTRRDLGASVLHVSLGRAGWRRASAWGLALRTQLGTTIAWCVATAAVGLIAGALSPVVAEAVGANDELAELIGRLVADLEVETAELFTIALLGISATLAAAAGVQAIIRLRTEEAEGRAELLLATPLSRTAWFVRQLVVALGSTVLVAGAAGLAAGLGSALAEGDGTRVGTSLAAIGAHLPAAVIFVALTAVAFAVVPRATAALGWGLLVAGLVLGQLGDLLGLPEWLQDVSPFRHVAAVPIEEVDVAASVIMLAVAAVFAAGAALALRRRDVPA